MEDTHYYNDFSFTPILNRTVTSIRNGMTGSSYNSSSILYRYDPAWTPTTSSWTPTSNLYETITDASYIQFYNQIFAIDNPTNYPFTQGYGKDVNIQMEGITMDISGVPFIGSYSIQEMQRKPFYLPDETVSMTDVSVLDLFEYVPNNYVIKPENYDTSLNVTKNGNTFSYFSPSDVKSYYFSYDTVASSWYGYRQYGFIDQISRVNNIELFPPPFTIDTALLSNSNITTPISQVTLGYYVTEIGANVFENATFTKVSIPATVTTIGAEAFKGSSCSTFIVSTNIATIGDEAFYVNSNISTIVTILRVSTLGNPIILGSSLFNPLCTNNIYVYDSTDGLFYKATYTLSEGVSTITKDDPSIEYYTRSGIITQLGVTFDDLEYAGYISRVEASSPQLSTAFEYKRIQNYGNPSSNVNNILVNRYNSVIVDNIPQFILIDLSDNIILPT